MAAPFAQTTRSLEADRSYGKTAALAAFSLLLAAWLVWAFAARVPARLTSETDQIQLGEIITVTFGSEATGQLTTGQAALVILDRPPLAETLVVPARVIDAQPAGEKVQVRLLPDFSRLEEGPVSDEIVAAFTQPTAGRVVVEVERVSPASLALRAAGLTADTAPIVVNP